MKKLYMFVHNHFTGVIRFWLLCLVPCAFSRHFAEWMLTLNLLMYMLLLCGRYNDWDKED